MASRISQPLVCPIVVGREDVLEGLRQLHTDPEARGRVALISGEAGIGKSRVLAAFLAALKDGSARRTAVARFFERDAAVPYSAVARIVLELVRAEVVAKPVVASVALELARVLPEIWEAIGVDAPEAAAVRDAEVDRTRLVGAFARVLASALPHSCTALAFEDVHWADASSLEVILQLARSAPAGCLVVLTFRSDEASPQLQSMLAELDRDRLAIEVRLGQLNVAEIDRMIRATLQAGHATRADVLHLIHQLTNGNPFFVEELLRTILDSAGAGADLTAMQLTDVVVPRTIEELLRRRSSDLSAEALQVLELAAVVGVRFDLPLLADLTGLDATYLLELVKQFVAAQLVAEEARGDFAFRHALTREAIRGKLLRHERRAISERIAQRLEVTHADDLDAAAASLALHFLEAEDWAKAYDYSTRAGVRALAVHAPAEALVQLNRAIEAGDHAIGPDRASTLRLRGTANEAVGDFEAARADYEQAVADAEHAGQTAIAWRALLDLGLLWTSRDYARAEPYFDRALRAAQDLGDPAAIGYSLNRLGNWLVNTGDIQGARRLHDDALATFRAAGDSEGVAQTLDLLGMDCIQAMDLEQAAAYYLEAVPLLEALDDERTLTSTLASIQLAGGSYQSDMSVAAFSLRQGSMHGQRALEIARRLGWRASESYALWQLAFGLGPQGEYVRALASAEEALRIAREIGHTQWETAAECALGALHIDILATDAARTHIERAIELSAAMGSDLWTAQTQALLIDARVTARDIEGALRVFDTQELGNAGEFGTRQVATSGVDAVIAAGDHERALALLDALDASGAPSAHGGIAVRLARQRGRARMLAGDLDAAVAQLRSAEAAAEAQEHRSALWRIHADLATALSTAGDREAARAAAAASAAIVDALALGIEDATLHAGFVEKAALYLPAALRRHAMSPRGGLALSAREAEVAALIAEGLTNREISERLVLSPRTVESHVANAMSKLGVNTRAQLAAWAVAGSAASDD